MDKFIIVQKSGNRITGPIMVTTSPRNTCPLACPLRKNGTTPEAGVCYAEHGHLGHYIWNGLDKTAAGKMISGRIPVYSFTDLLSAIREQPEGALWRHNQAGDLPSADCKIARNFDPTFKVSQRIDLVAKYWNWEVHLSRPIVTPPEKWILTSNQ